MTTGMKRVLIGCAVGCGVVIVAAIVAVVLFFVWLNREKPPAETRFLLEESTRSYVESYLDPKDDGPVDLVQAVLTAAQKRSAQGKADTPFAQMMQGMRTGSMRREDLAAFLPVRLAYATWGGGSGSPESSVGIVSMGPRYNYIMGPASLVLRSSGRSEMHGSYRIFLLGEKECATVVQNSILFANDVAALRSALDRFGAAAPGRFPPAAAGLREELPAEADAWGFLVNDGNALADWLPPSPNAPGPSAPLTSRVGVAGFSLDILPRDRLAIQVRLRTDSPESAAAILPDAIRWVREATLGRGLTGEVTGRIEGSSAIVEGEMEGLAQILTKAMESAGQQRIPTSPPVPGPESGPEALPLPSGESAGAAPPPP